MFIYPAKKIPVTGDNIISVFSSYTVSATARVMWKEVETMWK